MAGKGSSRMVYKAECPIEYRFVCEACAHESGPFTGYAQAYMNAKVSSGSMFKMSYEYSIEANEKARINAELILLKIIENINDTIHNNLISPEITNKRNETAQCFNNIFTHAKACLSCKAEQSWYPMPSTKSQLMKQAQKVKQRTKTEKPLLKYGSISTTLESGLPDAAYQTEAVDKPEDVLVRIINRKDASNQHDMAIRHLVNARHTNLQKVFAVDELGHDVFSVKEEAMVDAPLPKRVHDKMNEGDYQDYMLQLFDAVEYLHTHNPPMCHNNVHVNNVYVSDQNVITLAGYDDLSISDAFEKDIHDIGVVMGCAPNTFKKRYKKVIDKAVCEKYLSVEMLRNDYMKAMKTSRLKAVAVLFPIIFGLLFLARQFL